MDSRELKKIEIEILHTPPPKKRHSTSPSIKSAAEISSNLALQVALYYNAFYAMGYGGITIFEAFYKVCFVFVIVLHKICW